MWIVRPHLALQLPYEILTVLYLARILSRLGNLSIPCIATVLSLAAFLMLAL